MTSRRRFTPRSAEPEPGQKPFSLPVALAKLPGGRTGLPREFVEQNQRNRIVLGALSVFGEKGFAAATVQDLTKEASVSRATFYKYFDDKPSCFRIVHEEALGWLEGEGRDAAKAAADWPDAVLAVSERIVDLLINDPRLARLCAVEWVLGGPEVRARQDATLAALAAGLRKGRDKQPAGRDLPDALESFLVGGALSLVARKIAYGERPGAKALALELPEFILIPYLGVAEARRVVSRSG